MYSKKIQLRWDAYNTVEKGGYLMEDFALTGATWFWLFVPMPILLILSTITLFTDRGEK